MPRPVAVFLIFLLTAVLLKSALLVIWARKLHRQHPSHTLGSNLLRLLGLKPYRPFGLYETDMDPELWKDFAPIQRMNLISNFILCVTAALLVMGMGALNRIFGQ